jgi:general secretion pathway protein G
MICGSTKAIIQKSEENHRGFTLVEILMALAILGILAALAIPSFIGYRYKAKIVLAVTEIKMIEKAIITHEIEKGKLPDSLIEIDVVQITDPWGKPYQYLRLDGGTTPGIKGKRRRDKNANPVNSDFDLYSMGRDGKTAAQFTAKPARDDIVRANDGAYYGMAEKH